MRLATGSLALLAAIPVAPGRAAPREIALDRDDIVVTGDVVVAPGTWRVADRNGDGVLQVKTDGVTIDFRGATLVGNDAATEADAFEGIGIRVAGARGVTIRNAVLRGFRVGIQAEDCVNLRIEGCDVGGMRRMRLRSTPEREDAADWLWHHENDDGQWGRYGAGIWARRCTDSDFVANRARASQNGLLLDRSDGCRVHDNDFSFLSGLGLGLWRSSRNEVAHNRFDWCVRGYSHGVYDRGQDSAGILVYEQCNENVFAYNSATHGGDGFFLYAGNETLERTGEGGCNGNLLYRNDFSHAVANGIEATFSKGNVFAENILDDCSQHGIWAGYSSETTIVQNHIGEAGGGAISIEHGHDNWIEGNTIVGGNVGIELWQNETSPFAEKPYGKSRETRSLRNTILRNVLRRTRRAIDLRGTAETTVRLNLFDDAREGLRVAGDCPGTRVEENAFRVGAEPPSLLVRNDSETELRLGRNAFGTRDVAPWIGPRVVAGPALGREPTIDPRESGRRVQAPRVGGTLDAFLPKGALRGRKWIVIDEWGPWDLVAPRVSPAYATGSEEATIALLGRAGRFRVGETPARITIEPRTGTLPATLRVRLAPEAAGGVEFDVPIALEGADEPLRARGFLLRATWRVRFFRWDPSTGDPRSGEAARRALGGAPIHQGALDRLELRPGGGAPFPEVPADHFATVAETAIDLPAGRYEIRTVSDDGVRVLVDGKIVQEDWTWHPPKESVATLDLAAGRHAIRVEHFEIDGVAELVLSLRPAP